MWKGIKAFFGGGSTYFYLLIGGVFVGMYGYINYLEARLDTVKTQRDNAIHQAKAHGTIADSQNRTDAHESQNQKDAEDAKNKLDAQPNPIDYAFEWVRDRREAERNSDK